MSRRRKKKRRRQARPDSPAQNMESAAPQAAAAVADKEGGAARFLNSRLGGFAVILVIQLALLGFFYAMAGEFPAEAKITAADQVSLPGKTVKVHTRIRYRLPPLLRSMPQRVMVRIGLQGEKPVDWEVEPSSRVTVGLTAPEKPGIYSIKLVADPEGSVGIGPLETSSVLKVVAAAKPSSP